MLIPEPSRAAEVEHLLHNAQLRDQIDPLYDESIGRVNVEKMSLRSENEFLESMIEWEHAPMLPISQWFSPELILEHPDTLNKQALAEELYTLIFKLFEQGIVLEFTGHLSEYQLYVVIYRDILSSVEKMLNRKNNFLHWDCADTSGDPETWLTYYATDEERVMWQEEFNEFIPPHQEPPFRRNLPRASM